MKDNKNPYLETGNNEVDFLEFIVSGSSYGLNISKVSQTVLLKDNPVSRMPGAVEGILGMIQYRGSPVTVVDLKTVLDGQGEEVSEDRKLLLVAEFNNRTISFVIDDVVSIHRGSWRDFKPLEAKVFDSSENCVVGTLSIQDRVIMILDVEAIMSRLDPSMKIHMGETSLLETNEVRSSTRIIYCEDSSIVQKLLTNTLAQAGYTNIKSFNNGKEGFDYLTSKDCGQVDVILSDIEMPEMDGLTLCNNLRKLEVFEKTPFIFFSSMINESMRTKCNSVGGTEAYSKPELDKIVASLDLKFLPK